MLCCDDFVSSPAVIGIRRLLCSMLCALFTHLTGCHACLAPSMPPPPSNTQTYAHTHVRLVLPTTYVYSVHCFVRPPTPSPSFPHFVHHSLLTESRILLSNLAPLVVPTWFLTFLSFILSLLLCFPLFSSVFCDTLCLSF